MNFHDADVNDAHGVCYLESINKYIPNDWSLGLSFGCRVEMATAVTLEETFIL